MTLVKRRVKVLDAEEGARLAAEGLARAEAAHNAEWAQRFDDAIDRLAAKQLLVCSDDVWDELGVDLDDHGRGSALGGAFQRAARDEVLAPLDLARRSRRPSQHRAWVGVWMSLSFKSEAHECLPCPVCVAL